MKKLITIMIGLCLILSAGQAFGWGKKKLPMVREKTAVPTVNDDISYGYTVPLLWWDTTNDTYWGLVDNTDGAAVWIQLGGEGQSITEQSGTTISAIDSSGIWICEDSGATCFHIDDNGLVSIAGGLDNTVIGGTTPAAGSFTDLVGTIVVVESIPISWAEGETSSPAGLTAKDQVKYRDFDYAADEDLIIEWVVPADLQEVTANEVKVRVRGLISNATAPAAGEGVAFQIGGCSIGSGDLVTCAEGTLVVSEEDDLNGDAGANAQWDSWVTGWVVITITNLTAGETVRFSLNRDVSDAQDDYEQDIGVSWLEIKYYRQIGSVTY